MRLVPVLLLLGLCACGGNSATQNSAPKPQDAQLVAMWKQAGYLLATQGANLNAAMTSLPANWVYPGATAETVPFTAAVNTVPDLTVAQLTAELGHAPKHNTDPTGVIHCPSNASGASYCAGFAENGAIYVAQSQVYNFGATGWEMQNVILSALGYNTEGR